MAEQRERRELQNGVVVLYSIAVPLGAGGPGDAVEEGQLVGLELLLEVLGHIVTERLLHGVHHVLDVRATREEWNKELVGDRHH